MKINNLKADYIQYIILLYALLLPLSKAATTSFSILFLIILISVKQFEIKKVAADLWKNKVFMYLLILIAMHIVSLLFVDADNIKDAISYTKRYFYLLLPAVFVYTFIKKEFIPKALSVFLLGMFISETVSYLIFFELIDFRGKHGVSHDPTPFMNHLDYSLFLAFSSLVLLNRIINEQSIRLKLVLTIFFASTTINLFVTGGRIGQLAFIGSFFFLLLLNFKHNLKVIFVSIILFSGMLYSAYNLSDIFNSRVNMGISDISEILENKNYCTSWGTRIGSFIISKDIFLENPILGVGVQNNMVEFNNLIDTKYQSMKCIKWVNTNHNQYIEVLTQFGIVGFYIFTMLFYSIYKIKFINKEYKNISVIFISVFLISFVGDTFFYRHFVLGLFGFFLAILLAQNRVEKEIARSLPG